MSKGKKEEKKEIIKKEEKVEKKEKAKKDCFFKNITFRTNLMFLIKAILAGICIGIGGTILLSLEDKVIGAWMFGIGLFLIVSNGFNLYTGKIGYVVNNKPIYLVEVLITLIGNFLGTGLVALLLKGTRIYNTISVKAMGMCNTKLDDSLGSLFILAIFCGILMYLAVNGYKTGKDILGKNLIVFLAVAVFILSGFEHSIADMYYFWIADMMNGTSIIALLVIVAGNSIGGVFIPLCEKLFVKTE